MKVLVLGATGNLGPSVVRGLLDNGHSVTALSRSASTNPPPHGITAVTADYTSHKSLVAAMAGFDAVVSTIGGDALSPSSIPAQKVIIDAAIAAGVKRFVPSEFGSDSASTRSKEVPLYHAKQAVREYLELKASEGLIEHTTIFNGPFAEWMLGMPTLGGFYPKEKKAEIFDGGVAPFPTTPLPSIGNAVGVALRKWDETKNRLFMIRGVYFGQEEILKVFEELTGGEKWAVENLKTKDEFNRGIEGLKKNPGDWTGGMMPCLRGVVYSEYFNYMFGDEDRIGKDNDLLEVKPLDKEGLRQFVKGILGQK